MARKRWRRLFLAGVTLCWIAAGSASASGPGEPAPHYLDQFGGNRADLKQIWGGRIGVVMARSPRAELYMKWRLLHGLPVGSAAGEMLSKPCCDLDPLSESQGVSATSTWTDARKSVEGAPALERPWIDRERPGDDNVSIQTCFNDAFDFATRTLKDHIRVHGASDPGVRAWLATQDAVFAACSSGAAQLPAMPAGAPAWLKADRAYQEAAFALYQGNYEEAASRFQAMIGDSASPYRSGAAYLAARALWRNALVHPGAASEAEARKALDRLAVTPPGSYGRSQLQPMREAMEVRLHPEIARPHLEHLLASPDAPVDLAIRFRDLSDLSDAAAARGEPPSEVLDWIATMKGALTRPQQKPATNDAASSSDDASPDIEANRREALAHAAARWTSSRDPAWLLAALSLANPGEHETTALGAEAGKIVPTYPGWLTLQHHLIRLRQTSSPATDIRAQLDGLLAQSSLSINDRNLLLAERAQVSANLDDLMAHVMRQSICFDRDLDQGCVRDDWNTDSYQSGGVLDDDSQAGSVGLGDDVRAILDRMPLALRLKAGDDQRLAPRLRLDLALTNFARAVDLQDGSAVDGLCGKIEALLPTMAADFASIRKAAPGADKRFAEFFVLAKIPGLRSDLIDYTRPQGRAVSDYQGYWIDWIVLAKGHPLASNAPPELYLYQLDGQGADSKAPPDHLDLTCLGECGMGAEPLRLPDFLAKVQTQALAERAYFLRAPQTFYGSGRTNPPLELPSGANSVWNEMLTYVSAHPNDPRAPEALYWLVHVGHFGGSHDHSGRRAFKLLKARYAASPWAAKVKYYYD